MQPTNSSSTGTGLSRFRSAPATWLEALLESEEEDVIIDPPKPIVTPHTCTTVRPAATYVDPPNLYLPNSISRQNSSPAEFLSQISSNPGAFLSANYDAALDNQRLNTFTTQMSGDQSALLDVEMDKILGDTVPCRVRAKRGCATHPRSIAERVRRTRISDRIRKLQDLVPNMDKQTNTADMLEEAVEYVKFLQGQIKELREHRDKCTCLIKD